jgi:hypothetical protein
LVKLEADLDLVDLRPVIQLVEADPADPAAGRLVSTRFYPPWGSDTGRLQEEKGD